MTLEEVLQLAYCKIKPVIGGKTGQFHFTLELNTNQGVIGDASIEQNWKEKLKSGKSATFSELKL